MKHHIKNVIDQAIGQVYPGAKADFSVDRPPGNIDADFSSNAALILAKIFKKNPLEAAKEIASALRLRNDEFTVEIARPGFLNFKLPASFWQDELNRILQEKGKYGGSKTYQGKKARVEYVSANPTGPVHVGNVRGGPYGETLCRILESQGYEVLREYLHNDIGGQVEKLGQTVWHWYKGGQDEFPENGYKGEYPTELAQKARQKFGETLTQQNLPALTQFAVDEIFQENLETMGRLGIKFNLIVKESELRESGKTERAVSEMKKKGVAVEKEGALWFAPDDEFLGDRESVIVRSNGIPTYFASDIAYHKEKFTSGYDLVVDVLGSNHHGHVPKLQALTKIYGFDPEKFKVLLYQYVRVKRGNEVVKMAKRAGNFITAKEVLDEVGKDSMIFMLLMTAVNTHVDFDLELARETSEKNPVYKIKYAHARIRSILKKIKDQKSPPKTDRPWAEKINTEIQGGELFKNKPAQDLVKELAKFPEIVAEIAETHTVHHLPHYLLGLADQFHKFYEKVRVISEDEAETAARAAVVLAAQIVLKNGLTLLGIEAPEEM